MNYPILSPPLIYRGYIYFISADNRIICVDIDEKKISQLEKGIIPIYEPGLSTLVLDNQKKGTLRFLTNIKEALSSSDILFIAVGTPMGDDAKCTL